MNVWVDFENAPHVWVLSPIIEALRRQGYSVVLTARDFSYTLGLCHRFGYSADAVSVPGISRNKIGKSLLLIVRALRLTALMKHKGQQIDLALSHCSRSQIIAARLLGVKIISMDDYEHSDQSVVRFVNSLLVPFPIPKEHWGHNAGKVVHYPGLKEEFYLSRFTPGVEIPELCNGRVNILFRPEGRSTHYHSQLSEILQRAILDYLSGREDALVVLLPRDAWQARELADYCTVNRLPYWMPEEVLDGPGLIWQMDLVIGGGGTMTREAAVLGVPAYSFFGARWGAVDQYLQSMGRLVQIAGPEDAKRIILRRREPTRHVDISDKGLEFVTNFVIESIKGTG
jgi:predicted glycosyltransferase